MPSLSSLTELHKILWNLPAEPGDNVVKWVRIFCLIPGLNSSNSLICKGLDRPSGRLSLANGGNNVV